MDIQAHFLSCLTDEQKQTFTGLKSPALIQAYLDSIPYRVEDDNCCVLSIFRDGKAHCFDGSLFGAAALRQIGHDPVVVQMLPENDDDHMLAIYKRNGYFGAVAKSNFVGLRSREPVYSSIRELVMSYFRDYYNLDGSFSLRGYTSPLNLRQFDRFDWMSSDEGALVIYRRLHDIRKFRLLTPEMAAGLNPIDETSYKSGMSIANIEGIYNPDTSPKKDFGF